MVAKIVVREPGRLVVEADPKQIALFCRRIREVGWDVFGHEIVTDAFPEAHMDDDAIFEPDFDLEWAVGPDTEIVFTPEDEPEGSAS